MAREEIVKMVVPSAGDPRVGPQDCEPGAGMDGPNSSQSSIACADIVTEGGCPWRFRSGTEVCCRRRSAPIEPRMGQMVLPLESNKADF